MKSVTNSLPIYSMFTNALPESVCKKIDKMNRNFLWGSTEERRKTHLVKWDIVCKSHDRGGLGIRKCKESNLAMLAKTGYNLLKDEKALWTKV